MHKPYNTKELLAELIQIKLAQHGIKTKNKPIK